MPVGGPTDCIDSIHANIQAVRCHGLRNGVIRIDSVYGGTGPYYYSLDGTTYSTFPFFDRLWAGDYTLWVRDAVGCVKIENLNVPEPELLEIQLSASDSTVNTGVPVELRASFSPEQTLIRKISWRPPQYFPEQNKLEQTVQLQETTTIAVEMLTKEGCSASAQLTIEVEKINYFFPNIIKPGSNADAYFTVFSEEGLHAVENLKVFSRDGALIFERSQFPPNDPLSGWNGKYRDRFVSPGVYPWTVILAFEDGHREQHSGSITVVR
ncbi:MAG: hypothetical protein IPL65_03335 [Lewinellaceae bacterium]|nr:hypothetical protein [Lewinellaceae bacterium]